MVFLGSSEALDAQSQCPLLQKMIAAPHPSIKFSLMASLSFDYALEAGNKLLHTGHDSENDGSYRTSIPMESRDSSSAKELTAAKLERSASQPFLAPRRENHI